MGGYLDAGCTAPYRTRKGILPTARSSSASDCLSDPHLCLPAHLHSHMTVSHQTLQYFLREVLRYLTNPSSKILLRDPLAWSVLGASISSPLFLPD